MIGGTSACVCVCTCMRVRKRLCVPRLSFLILPFNRLCDTLKRQRAPLKGRKWCGGGRWRGGGGGCGGGRGRERGRTPLQPGLQPSRDTKEDSYPGSRLLPLPFLTLSSPLQASPVLTLSSLPHPHRPVQCSPSPPSLTNTGQSSAHPLTPTGQCSAHHLLPPSPLQASAPPPSLPPPPVSFTTAMLLPASYSPPLTTTSLPPHQCRAPHLIAPPRPLRLRL